MFWVDFTNDRIYRAPGPEQPSSSQRTILVGSGISCSGTATQFHVMIIYHGLKFDVGSRDSIDRQFMSKREKGELLFAEGLAWDWINQKIYWTDYCDDEIEVYDPLTSYRRVLFDTGLSNPYAIVVDPTTG